MLPATPEGENGGRMDIPDTAVLVQYGAYREFAPSPVSPGVGGNDEPRRGLYLVRLVTAETKGCEGCRGWLVVGRLDALPDPGVTQSSAPTTAPADLVSIQLPAELGAQLSADRDALLGRVVFVEGKVLANQRACGRNPAPCNQWDLAGTTEQVTMADITAAQLDPESSFMLDGPLAFRVLPVGLEYLGWLGSFAEDGGFTAEVAVLEDLGMMPRGPVTVAVDGWLVAGPLQHCLLQIGVEGLTDTAFVTCPPAWLTRDEVQATQLTDGAISDEQPSPAIRVQYSAYSQYAPSPLPDAAVPAPQRGTYLVRLLRNPNAPDPEAARSWQVVGRLDPPQSPASPNHFMPIDATPQPSP